MPFGVRKQSFRFSLCFDSEFSGTTGRSTRDKATLTFRTPEKAPLRLHGGAGESMLAQALFFGGNELANLYKGSEPVPADAVVLFNGKDLSNWHKRGSDDPAGWTVADGYFEVKPGTGDICTKETFGSFQLHVEFWLPLMADCQGQARANSGVYIQGRYEVQVLDSYGLDSKDDDCGGLYKLAAPMLNAGRPPENWQTYDIYFIAPKYNEHGVKTKNAKLSVLLNGVWIHHNLNLPQPTPGNMDDNCGEPGPVLLQDHGNLIRFRNVWARPIG